MRGSEKNRGTVITSLQLAFRRRDRNFTPFTINKLRNSAGDKNTPDTFSIAFACLQICPFETVIFYSFRDIPPNKIGKHAQVKLFPKQSAKHARFTTD